MSVHGVPAPIGLTHPPAAGGSSPRALETTAPLWDARGDGAVAARPEREARPGALAGLIPQALYNQILENVPIACVDVAVVSNGCVLLVERRDAPAKGAWWVPGGRVLKGERMRETALRKAREEVGIDCHVGPIVHTAETIFPDGPGGIAVHSINSCFLVYPVEDGARARVRLDDHHSGWRWVSRISPDLHPYVVQCLRGAGLE